MFPIDHHSLVTTVALAIEHQHPIFTVLTDPKRHPADPLPPTISGHRPDVYAWDPDASLTIIAEAKTDNDIDNAHTYSQLQAFLGHLQRRRTGLLVLAVTAYRANFAKTVLRFLLPATTAPIQIAVHDGCDFWYLRHEGTITWHLS